MDDKLKLMDKRVIERNLGKGLISQKEVEAHLKKLPDLEAEAEELILDVHDDEDGEAVEGKEMAEA